MVRFNVDNRTTKVFDLKRAGYLEAKVRNKVKKGTNFKNLDTSNNRI